MIATYRLQLAPDFGFDAAADAVPYLARLGISHLYLSPVTDARRGSVHGYDVVDHNRIRAELGGEPAFDRLCAAARAQGLKLLIDFVPNHAGVGPRNAWWQDVLAFGASSPFARFFDIDWKPLKPELAGKVLLPVLGSPYGQALEAREIGLVAEDGRLSASYYRQRFALSPATWSDALIAASATTHGSARGVLDAAARATARLFPHDLEKAREAREHLAPLAERDDVAKAFAAIEPATLHALLERQHFRLAWWKTAGSEINYRRFFSINELVALRMEEPDVFRATHGLLEKLLALDVVDGVRIDHIDGLYDPHGYLSALTALGAKKIWVEKILAPDETLADGWPVEGTTGYEFLGDVQGLLVTPAGREALERLRRELDPAARSWDDEVFDSKRTVMRTDLSGELTRLAHGLDRMSEADFHTRDVTRQALEDALGNLIACFPRYRTYLPHDRFGSEKVIDAAIGDARRRDPVGEAAVYDFLRRILLGDVAAELAETRRAWIGRFQQYTAPVAAKGVEDTAYYRHVRLAAACEVGAEPDHSSLSTAEFHARVASRARRHPRTLLATSTHDTKRGEDTRMRMLVLAEIPDRWSEAVHALRGVAARHAGSPAVDPASLHLFFQTVAALWDPADATLADRLVEYARKAAREAKLHTGWASPHASWEAALERCVRGVVADPEAAAIVAPIADLLARHGFANSISQLVVKATAAGVPDFYRGCEWLELVLVDPDNRRPVDFAARAEMLRGLDDAREADPLAISGDRAKLHVTRTLLRLRRSHTAAFDAGYAPLAAEGTRADHAVAFARGAGEVVVCVPRFPATLESAGGFGDTSIATPLQGPARDVLRNRRVADASRIALAQLPPPFVLVRD